MSKKMELAYKALRVEDATDAVLQRFPIGVVIIGIIAIAILALEWDSAPAYVYGTLFVILAAIVAVGILIFAVGIIATLVRRHTGYSEVELERLGLA